MKPAPAVRALVLLVLFALAAGYFALGCTLTLEWADEGHLIYQSWRVSDGALPYRDMLHPYAPSVFLLNGWLLRLFGPQLLVVRLSLVILKAALAVLVYAGARQLTSWPWALAVYGLFVAMWGAPMWLFNAPYASHYALVAVLGGTLAFVRLRAGAPLIACALAGLCFGVATTFKQTSGPFAAAALALFLLWAGLPGATPQPRTGSDDPALMRLARLGVLLGVGAFCAAYLWPRNTPWNVFVLFTPMVLAIGSVFIRELRHPPREASHATRALAGILCCGLAMSIPIAIYAAWFAAHGLLGALLFNTLAGLPQLMQWFIPVPYPDPRSALALAAVVLVLIAARAVARSRWTVALAAGTAFAVAAAAFAYAVAREAGIWAWARTSGWQGDVLRLYFYLPFVALWGAVPFVFRRAAAMHSSTAVLFWFLAASSLLYLYPAGDFWHVIMTMPLFLPLIALQLDRWQRVEASPPAAPPTRPDVFAACVAALLALLAAPPVLSLLTTRAQLAGVQPAFARARGIVALSSKYGEAAQLVEFLATQQPPQRTVFITANEQMLYFLSGRISALDRYEFVLYLTAAGLIRDEDARALAPQSELVGALERQRPLVVDYQDSPSGAAVRRAFPQVAAYLEQHYQPFRSIGGYRVLDRQTP